MLVAFWFGLIAVLWAGYFVLEGFDFGVGMLLPFIGHTERDRDQALRTIGPVWDGNEVWLIVAGGATFAAFPEWYATAFSGFYLAFAFLLVGLILRGIGIEYRSKAATATGRRWCEAAIVLGSFLPALLLGVAFADFVRGLTMNHQHVVTGGFFEQLSPYALLGGLTTLSLFLFHGALFLALRTDGAVAVTADQLARRLAWPTGVLAAGFLVWTTGLRGGVVSDVLGVVIVLSLVAAIRALLRDRYGLAFSASAAVAGLVPIFVFACLWPDVLPARNGSSYSLTAHGASSSHYTLVVMTVVALVFTPIVLTYQAWSYWVFRARVGVPALAPGSAPTGLIDKVRKAAGDVATGKPIASDTESLRERRSDTESLRERRSDTESLRERRSTDDPVKDPAQPVEPVIDSP